MFRLVISVLLFFCFTNSVLGQEKEKRKNLIYNYSFEDHLYCPQKIEPYGQMMEVEAWWQPTGGSSDYYHPCGGKESTLQRLLIVNIFKPNLKRLFKRVRNINLVFGLAFRNTQQERLQLWVVCLQMRE